jgi:hypothetical protein
MIKEYKQDIHGPTDDTSFSVDKVYNAKNIFGLLLSIEK